MWTVQLLSGDRVVILRLKNKRRQENWVYCGFLAALEGSLNFDNMQQNRKREDFRFYCIDSICSVTLALSLDTIITVYVLLYTG